LTTSKQAAESQVVAAENVSFCRWYLWLGLVALGGMALPAIWIVRSKRHAILGGDALYFHGQAQAIRSGVGWFIDPITYIQNPSVVHPGASHPPLWTFLLFIADSIGLTSYFSQLLFACVLGAAAVAMTGLAAREFAGPRAGIIAAAIAALYPNYWINYGLGLGETTLLFIIAAVLFVSVRLWRKPSYGRAAALGGLCALAALTRAEQSLLVLFVMVPMILLMRQVGIRRRLGYAGVGIAAAVIVVAPWVGFNMARFTKTTFLSTDSGSTLATANCRPTYYGPFVGYGDLQCLTEIKIPRGDESVVDAQLRHVGLSYAKKHASRLPVVLTARVGRELGLFDPLKQLHIEQLVNNRPYWPAEVGLFMYYGTAALAVLGAIELRRRRLTLVPFVGIFLGVVVTAMATFGETRYRVPLDVALVVVSSVALDNLLLRTQRSASARSSAVALADES
jgi:4-amino-4-deoxy-L-arabinose transferase-like glycosyltransferase